VTAYRKRQLLVYAGYVAAIAVVFNLPYELLRLNAWSSATFMFFVVHILFSKAAIRTAFWLAVPIGLVILYIVFESCVLIYEYFGKVWQIESQRIYTASSIVSIIAFFLLMFLLIELVNLAARKMEKDKHSPKD
jgi:hypothetical protein